MARPLQAFGMEGLGNLRVHPLFKSWKSQKAWMDEVHWVAHATLTAGTDVRQRELAVLQDLEHGSAWVNALSGSMLGVTLSPPEWQALLRARVDVLMEADHLPCYHCHMEADVWEDHRLGFALCGPHRRHNTIRDYLVRKAFEARWSAVVEPQLWRDIGTRTNILMQGFAWAPLNSEACDITFTHSLHESASTAACVTPGVYVMEA